MLSIQHFSFVNQRYDDFAFCGEDQRAFQRFFLDATAMMAASAANVYRPPRVELDSKSSVFQCMHGHSWSVDIEVVSGDRGRGVERGAGASGGGASGIGNGPFAVPLLSEVLDDDDDVDDNGDGDSNDNGAAAINKVVKRPLVMHFNSHDGKGMMRTLVDALEQSAAGAAAAAGATG